MVDDATLTLIATAVQTIVITLTLVVFIFQFRSQEKALKESSYQSLLGRYNDFIMSGSDSDPLFARLLSESESGMRPEDVPSLRRLMISYGIIEEAYELYSKKWIDEESWEQWNSWLKSLCRHPHFRFLHSATEGMFDKGFQAHVSRLLEADSGRSPTQSRTA